MTKRRPQTHPFVAISSLCLLLVLPMAAHAEILYEQDFDNLTTLGTPPGFEPLPALERNPTALATDDFALTGSQLVFIPAQSDVFTIDLLMAAIEESTPDSTGAEFLVRGRETGSEQPGVQIRWGQVANGRPAYYDDVEWTQIGDTNFDGMENDGEIWPPALPISDAADPGSAQWVPIRLVVEPADGTFQYWQGDPNDSAFATLAQYDQGLVMRTDQPTITNYSLSMPAGSVFVDNVRIYTDQRVVYEDDYEGQPSRADNVIAIGSKSLTLLQNIDNGVVRFDSLEENFTIRFLMAVTVQGSQNSRAAQCIVRGSGGTGPQLGWGELNTGQAAYYDGAAWRQVGDDNLNGTQDAGEVWPPPLEVSDPEDPGSAKWYAIEIYTNLETGKFNYHQGAVNDLTFDNMTQYGGELQQRQVLLAGTNTVFQNSQRGGGVFYIENFGLLNAAGDTVLSEDFDGDWEVRPPQLTGGGVLEENFAVGAKSIRLRSTTDNVSIDFPAQSETVFFDFLLGTTVDGEDGARAAQLQIREGGTIAPQLAWGQTQPGRAAFYDGSSWVTIGDADKDGAEGGGEAWSPPVPPSNPDGGPTNWTATRIVANPVTDTFEFWQGAPGDTEFSSLVRVLPDPTFRNVAETISNAVFVAASRSGGDFFLDNIKIYTEMVSVEDWSLY